ncbi:protoporphyrinogen oxidase HemJ [Aureimonas sp. AU40]|uniref:protoporphyrinogen oxidase HemJ n=1 Tax=Aureimonas sp. AU40 TaxID=1637747 RepID=UPI000780C0E5|nr:protoporphyrinogen oxidase HemJ [Aureimonas sp. AU40]
MSSIAPAKDRSVIVSLGIGALLALALFALVPVDAMLWVKALHVLAVISWMVGMFYLPRLFVYHTEAGVGSPQAETFKVMERRLMQAIVNPAMVVTWVSGLWLAIEVYRFQGGWLHAKFALVILMSGLHGYFSASRKRLARDEMTKSSRHWRMMNEVPTILLVAIVILVIVKPF